MKRAAALLVGMFVFTISHAKQEFKSPVVLISEQGIPFYQKNSSKIVPIASITKLMVAVAVLESEVPLNETVTITKQDVVSASPLRIGDTLTRAQLMNLALMSSDNRAAHALARSITGDTKYTIGLMNRIAIRLGMDSTRYVEPTGLSPYNRSSASDLSKLLSYASTLPTITEYSTMSSKIFPRKTFRNTNAYIRNGSWTDVLVSKTGFTNAAGKCIVVALSYKGRVYDIVILGSRSSSQRLRDLATAKRVIIAQT